MSTSNINTSFPPSFEILSLSSNQETVVVSNEATNCVKIARDYWLKEAQSLSESDRERFTGYIYQITGRIDHIISHMPVHSRSAQQIKSVTDKVLGELPKLAHQFLNRCESYQIAKLDLHHDFVKIDNKIKNNLDVDFNAFSFTPITNKNDQVNKRTR